MVVGCGGSVSAEPLGEGGASMRYVAMTGLAALVLGGAADVCLAEARGKTDGCLTTLYNYPAEVSPGGASARAASESPPTRRGVRPRPRRRPPKR